MKTNFYFLLCLMAIVSFFAIACEDESDTTLPVINLIEPEEGDTLQIGTDVHFTMKLFDNDMLKSYKVDIHNNFTPHTHAASGESTETVPFAYNHTWDVAAKAKKGDTLSVHHHEIIIAGNATPGAYHLVVYCTDVSGNESHVARNIVLSHEGGEHEEHAED
ncbi:MAG: DUF4625 domain-containing protein [Odoribacteraceae bacterium]|jgi:hypothetical protein|nr:DUF4625 domain-containing protein [Odoribacteraceae bacterium]